MQNCSKIGVTQTYLAEVTGIDRKTLRAIDRGDAIKDSTLQKLALKMSLPPSSFLANANVDDQSALQEDASNEVLLSKMNSSSLCDCLDGCGTKTWKLELADIGEVEEKYLKQLDTEIEL